MVHHADHAESRAAFFALSPQLMLSRRTIESLDAARHARTSILSGSATVALTRVLNALRDGWLLEKRLSHVARMIVEEARAQRLSAEQMLAALDDEWPRLLEVRRVPDEANLHMLAERLMKLCTVEFQMASASCSTQQRRRAG